MNHRLRSQPYDHWAELRGYGTDLPRADLRTGRCARADPAVRKVFTRGMLSRMSDSFLSETVRINGHDGDEIEAYAVRVQDPAPRGGVVVIHHMPGYDDRTKEIARWFGHLGYNAIVPNLYWRDAPGASPDDAAAAGRANGGVPSERLIGDVDGGMTYLKSLE